MYITITAQKIGETYSKSSADYVAYLEKENEDIDQANREDFFNQYEDRISAEEIVTMIDGNTAKLEKTEPRFYSIVVSPSQYELKRLQNNSEDLKKYTRELMKAYVSSFHREINGRPITIDDIKYYAKIEHQRYFKGHDYQIKENQPYATIIMKLKNEIRKIDRGESEGNIKKIEKEILKLENAAPHKQQGNRIVQGMKKEGAQSHVHIIVSRKDASNRFSLSPGSKYKASTVTLNGSIVKRGFDRDGFFKNAEQCFDKTFSYKRNYVETYHARKTFIKDPKSYFSTMMKLPVNERSIAFYMLKNTGMTLLSHIPVSQGQLALKMFNKLRKGLDVAIKSSSIGI